MLSLQPIPHVYKDTSTSLLFSFLHKAAFHSCSLPSLNGAVKIHKHNSVVVAVNHC